MDERSPTQTPKASQNHTTRVMRAAESYPQEPAAPTSFKGAHSRSGTLRTTFLNEIINSIAKNGITH
jgi:hypothetical protein